MSRPTLFILTVAFDFNAYCKNIVFKVARFLIIIFFKKEADISSRKAQTVVDAAEILEVTPV